MPDVSAIISLMIQHNSGDPEKIYHMMKLYAFARAIATEEGIGDEAIELIETAAVLCELGKSSSESAAYADMLLLDLGCDREVIGKVNELILMAESAGNIDNIQQQIISEAMFLVMAYEKRLDKETIIEALNEKFRTTCGKQYLCNIFSVGNRRKSDSIIYEEQFEK